MPRNHDIKKAQGYQPWAFFLCVGHDTNLVVCKV